MGGYEIIISHTYPRNRCILHHVVLSVKLHCQFLNEKCKEKFRIIDLQVMKSPIEKIKNEDTEISLILMTQLGLYTFASCDTFSAFFGKGKIKAFNLMLHDISFDQLFQSLSTL